MLPDNLSKSSHQGINIFFVSLIVGDSIVENWGSLDGVLALGGQIEDYVDVVDKFVVVYDRGVVGLAVVVFDYLECLFYEWDSMLYGGSTLMSGRLHL